MSLSALSVDPEELRQKLDPVPCGVVRELVQAGYEAYIVGGAVRDLLLGALPKDYDISTSATPEQVRKVFGRRRCHIIGRRFRLAHVYSGGRLFEVSTFRRRPSAAERRGKYESDGVMIWNDNCFGTLHDDAGRRDFTVNALFFDVVGRQGIIDLHGGLRDIGEKVVRVIGRPEERMDEDPVRMLRALKLVGQLGFHLEDKLDEVICGHAVKIGLASPARLFEELLKLLNHPAAHCTLEVMQQHGLLKHFWPVLSEAWGEQEGRVAAHLLKLRGEAMRSGVYSSSRALALSTVAMPFMMTAMNPEQPGEFWHGSLFADEVPRRALELLFENFMVPRVLFERVLVILDLTPRLLRRPLSPRLCNNAEYRYARALAALLVQTFGWDPALVESLPDGYEALAAPEPAVESEDAGSGLLTFGNAEGAAAAPGEEDGGGDSITFSPVPGAAEREKARVRRRRRRRSGKRHAAAAEEGAEMPDNHSSEADN